MINLLPLQQKEELRREENFKLILNLAFLIFLFLISIYLIFYSINNFIIGTVESQKILLQEKANIEKDTGKEKDWINYNKDLVKQGKKPVTYTFYVDNIASKFDLGKMLFGGGITSPEEGTKHYPEGAGITPFPNVEKKAPAITGEVVGDKFIIGTKKYPIVNGLVEIGGKKFKVNIGK